MRVPSLTGNYSHKYSSSVRNWFEMTAQKETEKKKKKLSLYEIKSFTREIEKSMAYKVIYCVKSNILI